MDFLIFAIGPVMLPPCNPVLSQAPISHHLPSTTTTIITSTTNKAPTTNSTDGGQLSSHHGRTRTSVPVPRYHQVTFAVEQGELIQVNQISQDPVKSKTCSRTEIRALRHGNTANQSKLP